MRLRVMSLMVLTGLSTLFVARYVSMLQAQDAAPGAAAPAAGGPAAAPAGGAPGAGAPAVAPPMGGALGAANGTGLIEVAPGGRPLPAVPPQPYGTPVIGTSIGQGVQYYTDPNSGRNVTYAVVAHDLNDPAVGVVLNKYLKTEAEADRAPLVEELTGLLNKQFDERQAARETELKQLEEELQRLRTLHDRRGKEKAEIVRDRVRQLIRDAEGLGWGSQPQTGAFAPSTGATMRRLPLSFPTPPAGLNRN